MPSFAEGTMPKHGLGWGHDPEKPPRPGGVMILKTGGAMILKNSAPSGVMVLVNHTFTTSRSQFREWWT